MALLCAIVIMMAMAYTFINMLAEAPLYAFAIVIMEAYEEAFC